MKEGDVLLTALRQADGTLKHRPVVFLRRMPPFQDFLVCGVSTQLQQAATGLDELITPSEAKPTSDERLESAFPDPTRVSSRLASI